LARIAEEACVQDKIFLDTDVALIIWRTATIRRTCASAFGFAETGGLILCVSSLSFSNLYYILPKLKGMPDALAAARQVEVVGRVSAVTRGKSTRPLWGALQGFQDAIQHFAAMAEGQQRNRHAETKPIIGERDPVLSPDEFLAKLDRRQ